MMVERMNRKKFASQSKMCDCRLTSVLFASCNKTGYGIRFDNVPRKMLHSRQFMHLCTVNALVGQYWFNMKFPFHLAWFESIAQFMFHWVWWKSNLKPSELCSPRNVCVQTSFFIKKKHTNCQIWLDVCHFMHSYIISALARCNSHWCFISMFKWIIIYREIKFMTFGKWLTK